LTRMMKIALRDVKQDVQFCAMLLPDGEQESSG